MKITSISPSRAGTYKDCEWKYYLTSIIGLQTAGSVKTVNGEVVHKVLELLAKGKNRKSQWNDPYKLLAVTFPHFVAKNPKLNFTQADLDFCKKQIDVVLNSRLDPRKCTTLVTEFGFELEIRKPGFKVSPEKNFIVRGIIDRIDLVDKDTIEIIDYKTGQNKDWSTGKVIDEEYLKQDFQLQCYELAVRSMYPQYKYRLFTLFHTQAGGPLTVHFNDQETSSIIHKARTLFHSIKNNDDPLRLKDDPSRSAQRFKCNKVCDFGAKYQNNCDDLYRQFKNNQLVPLTVERRRAGPTYIQLEYK